MALFSVSAIYALSYTLTKVVMPQWIEPRGFILLRLIGAFLLMLPIQIFLVKEWVQNVKDLIHIAICALFGVCANMLLFFEGLSIASPIDTGLIMITTPILVFLGAWLLGKESMTWRKAIGLLLGTGCAMALIGMADHTAAEGSTFGNLLIFLNAAFFAVYLIISKPLMQRYSPITIVIYTFFFGGLMVLPFGARQLAAVQWNAMPASALAIVGYTIVFVTFITYFLNAWSLKRVSSSTVGSYIYVQPVLGTLFAITAGRYQLGWPQVAAGMGIMAAVWMITRKPRIDTD